MNTSGIIKLGKTVFGMMGNNLPAILAGVAVVGTIGAVYCAIVGSRKADEKLEAREEERSESGVDENLTKWEKFTTVAPAYIPTVACVVVTIACIVGANVVNAQRMAALTLTCGALKTQLKDKEADIKRLIDPNSPAKSDIALSTDNTVIEGEGDYFYDTISGNLFRSSIARINQIESLINQQLVENKGCQLSYVYKLIGGNIAGARCGDVYYWDTSDEKLPAKITVMFETMMVDGKPTTVGKLSYDGLQNYRDDVVNDAFFARGS